MNEETESEKEAFTHFLFSSPIIRPAPARMGEGDEMEEEMNVNEGSLGLLFL